MRDVRHTKNWIVFFFFHNNHVSQNVYKCELMRVGWDLVSECRESKFIHSHSILPCQWLLVALPSFLISVISGAGWDIISWHKGGFEVPARQRQESSCRWLPTRPLPWQLLLLVIVDEANDQLAQSRVNCEESGIGVHWRRSQIENPPNYQQTSSKTIFWPTVNP